MRWEGPALAAALTLSASCSGAPPPTTATRSAGDTVVTNDAAVAREAATSVPATAVPQPQLAQILAVAKTASSKVRYKIAVAGVDVLSGDQIWYIKPPRSRFDFADTQGGQTTTISSFTLPEGSYYCFAAAPAAAQCFTVSGVGSPLDQNAAVVTQRALIDHPERYSATFKEASTIAGQQALCYDVTATAPGTLGAGTFCYSRAGVALRSSFSVDGAAWSMEATELSTTVPDSDFTLPAKPLAP